MLEQAVLAQQVEGAPAEAREEQLLELVEEPRRRDVLEEARERRERRARGLVDREAEFRLEAHGTEHSHRVLAVACLWVADQADRPRADVFDAADVIPDREVLDVVVERVAGEVSSPHVLVDRAVHVVSQEPSAIVVQAVVVARISGLRDVAVDVAIFVEVFVGILVGDAVEVGIDRHRRTRGAKRRDLDDLMPEAHVRKAEAPADQAAVPEEPAHLLG
jgi:hypothetical protein